MQVENIVKRMEYNTQREKLKIIDYGRNVVKLIEFAKTIEDRDKRNKVANIIINVMSQVNATAKDCVDYEHKLWDHLMILSNYELDVDCPYAIAKDTSVNFTPKPLKYKNHKIKYRHYGKNMEDIISKTVEYPEGEEKNYLIELITHQLKRSYLTWNIDTVDDELIYQQLSELSNNGLKLPDGFELKKTREYLAQIVPLDKKNASASNKTKKKTKIQTNSNKTKKKAKQAKK